MYNVILKASAFSKKKILKIGFIGSVKMMKGERDSPISWTCYKAYPHAIFILHDINTHCNITKVEELKQEAGKISNVDLQRRVIRVFYYLCVVTLQYVCPMIMILYLSMLYKTLGGGSWNGSETAAQAGGGGECPLHAEDAARRQDEDIGVEDILQSEHVDAIKEQVTLAWSSFKHIFTPLVFKVIKY